MDKQVLDQLFESIRTLDKYLTYMTLVTHVIVELTGNRNADRIQI